MPSTSAETLFEEAIAHGQQRLSDQWARQLSEFPREVLAYLAAVPVWSYRLAQSIKIPFDNEMLDYLVYSGWCETRPSFVPGRAVFRVTPSKAGGFLQNSISFVRGETVPAERLRRLGLLRSTIGASEDQSPAPEDAELEKAAFEVVVPSGQARFRSAACAFRAMKHFPVGGIVELVLNSFQPGHPTLTLTGEVVASKGDNWSGFETTLTIRQPEVLTEALYREFNIAESRRAEMCQWLGDSVPWDTICRELAHRLEQGRRSNGVKFPAATVRWLKLARLLDRGPEYVSYRLVRRVEALLRRKLMGDAIGLLEVAAVLALAIRGEIETAVRLCWRRIELVYRSEVDESLLKSFLPRPEQIEPFDQLMRPDSDVWACHYLGLGGVGKTMLLRHLNRTLRDSGAAVVRVDFDNLDPNYPVRRPAQLLLELADGLRLHIRSDRAQVAFDDFLGRTRHLHGQLSVETPSPDPLANLHCDEFEQVLQSFCDFLITLPLPIVFILDTCEELARLQPDGFFQPGVQATFEILQRIWHFFADSSPPLNAIRVIFAGRRLLALAGNGWHARGSDLIERQRQFASELVAATPDDLRKDYLKLHEIRGFTRAEALRYLTQIKAPPPESRRTPMTTALAEAILTRTLDNTTACDFEWEPARPRDTEDRYNPFDLSLYADWYLEDSSTLDEDAIKSQRLDPYIEVRILQRLGRGHPRVLSLLPALVSVRRLDKQRLGEIARLSGMALDNLYHELCQIEWMDYEPRADGSTAILEVDRHLRTRLERYYGAPERAAIRRRTEDEIALWVRPKIQDQRLRDLDEDLVSVGLRLLPPAETAAFWIDLEARVPLEADWHWAAQVCEHLLAEKGPMPDPLRAAVRATLCAALLQTRRGGNLAESWREVAKCAPQHPSSKEAERLADRAVAGELTALARAGLTPEQGVIDRFWQAVGSRSEPVFGSAIEALLELAEALPTGSRQSLLRPVEAGVWLDGLHPSTERWLQGLAAALAYRCSWLSGLPANIHAVHAFGILCFICSDLAEDLPKIPNTKPAPPEWPLPARMEDRVRLELLCLGDVVDSLGSARREISDGIAHLSPLGQAQGTISRPTTIDLLRWGQTALDHTDQPESLWLVSKILELRLRDGALSSDEVGAVAGRISSARYVQPTNWSQRATPPLFVSLARAWSFAGESRSALELLDKELDSGRLDRASNLAALRAKAEVIERYDLKDRARVFQETLRTAGIRETEELLRRTGRLLSSEKETVAAPTALLAAPTSRWKQVGQMLLSVAIFAGAVVGCIKLGGWLFGQYSRLVNHAAGHPVGLGSRWLLLLALTAGLSVLAFTLRYGLRQGRSFLARWLELIESAAQICVQLRQTAADDEPHLPGENFNLNIHLVVRRIPSFTAAALFWRALAATYIEAIRAIGKTDWALRVSEALSTRFLSVSKQAVADWQLRLSSDGPTLQSDWASNEHQEQESSAETAPSVDPVLEELRDLLARSGQYPIRVALQTQPTIAGAAIESALASLLSQPSAGPPRLAPFRLLPPLPTLPHALRWARDPGVMASATWERTFRASWRLQYRRWWSTFWPWSPLPTTVQMSEYSGAAPHYRICHLVGTVRRTTSGVRFTVGQEGEEKTGREVLLSAEQVARREAGFIILQEAPTSFGPRSTSERERTAVARQFADELFRCGVWGVLVIPALPPTLARDVVGQLAAGLYSSAPPTLALLSNLSNQGRRSIREASPGLSGAPTAMLSPEQVQSILSGLAWELTLFARSAAHASLADDASTAVATLARKATA